MNNIFNRLNRCFVRFEADVAALVNAIIIIIILHGTECVGLSEGLMCFTAYFPNRCTFFLWFLDDIVIS